MKMKEIFSIIRLIIIKYNEKDFLDIHDKPIKNFKNHPNFCYSFFNQK